MRRAILPGSRSLYEFINPDQGISSTLSLVKTLGMSSKVFVDFFVVIEENVFAIASFVAKLFNVCFFPAPRPTKVHVMGIKARY